MILHSREQRTGQFCSMGGIMKIANEGDYLEGLHRMTFENRDVIGDFGDRLDKHTDDGRNYTVTYEFAYRVVVDPAQAEVGEYIDYGALSRLYFDVFGQFFTSEYCRLSIDGTQERTFECEKESGAWKRTA